MDRRTFERDALREKVRLGVLLVVMREEHRRRVVFGEISWSEGRKGFGGIARKFCKSASAASRNMKAAEVFLSRFPLKRRAAVTRSAIVCTPLFAREFAKWAGPVSSERALLFKIARRAS